MTRLDLDEKVFGSISNSPNGDVNGDTLFYYHQKDDYLWGHYKGGDVLAGVLIGKVLPDWRLQFDYSHFDSDGNYKAGKCQSRIILQENGLLKLEENWQWVTGDQSKGTSTLIEIRTN